MPTTIETKTILKIIKLKQEHPSWGWKKLSKATGISKNTIKKYVMMFENSTTEDIVVDDVIPSQYCKKCRIVVMNALPSRYSGKCPRCGKKMKVGVK